MTPFTKVSTLALSVFLTAGMAIPAFAALFTDTSGHWAQPAIENLAQKRVLTGYPTGEFRPEGRISRAEFATMLVKALHLENAYVDNGSNFVDVPQSYWGYRSIETVSDKGLISGYPGGYFRPTQNISRVEAMAVLVNAAHIPLPTDTEAAAVLRNYSDAYLIPEWARRSVAAAIQSGIYANFPNPNQLQPLTSASRAEVAMLAENMENSLAGRTMPSSTAMAPQQPPSMNTTPMQPPSMTQPQTSTSANYNQQDNMIRGRVSVVPAQTVFTGVVTQRASSEYNQVGDPITITLDRPIISAAGDIVIPQGSQVMGTIIRIDPAGRIEKNAGMVMDFNKVITPDGRTFPMSAEVNAENGILKGGTTAGRTGRIVGRTAGGAAIGGAAGAILGAIKGGGKADDYLARGAALGGLVGAASSVASQGNNVVLEPGEVLEIRLRQPLTVGSSPN